MIGTFGKAAFVFLRVFLVVFFFIADVKVRADALFQTVKGKVEVEKNGALVNVVSKSKLVEPFEIQTFAGGVVKTDVNSIYLGVDSRSLISVANQPKFDMTWGSIFVSSPIKDSEWISFHTPHCDVVTSGGEFFLDVRNGKTQLTVVAGSAEIRDRSARKNLTVRAGYSAWMGGLLATGLHAAGQPTALDFDPTLSRLKRLSNFSQAEWQSRYDHLRLLWKAAVDDVAQEDQDRVNGDLQLLHEIQEADLKREERHKREQARLRAQFRKEMLDGPDENQEAPSESDRAPATSGE